jgi:hypothetical protein
VYATGLTREAIWDAIRARRCYAVTGDRIGLRFAVNDANMGEETSGAGAREIRVSASGADALDRIEVVKNNRPLKRVFGPAPGVAPPDPVRAKVRVEWGWGDKDEWVRWDAKVRLSDGRLLSVEPCFTGDPVLAPSADGAVSATGEEHVHGILAQDERHVAWFSHTRGNAHPYLRGTNALILEMDAPRSAALEFTVNGAAYRYLVSDLVTGSRSEFIRGWRSEAMLVHRAVPEAQLQAALVFEDTGPECETDFYYVRVAQENNQWAWSSPIWVSG